MLYSCPTCGRINDTRTCPEHAPQKRPHFKARGYDAHYQRQRTKLLASKPLCVMGCGRPANVADHHPLSRKQLVALGVPDPDALKHLRPMCTRCHNAKSAKTRR